MYFTVTEQVYGLMQVMVPDERLCIPDKQDYCPGTQIHGYCEGTSIWSVAGKGSR